LVYLEKWLEENDSQHLDFDLWFLSDVRRKCKAEVGRPSNKVHELMLIGNAKQ
jgi:hypothetical protein